MSIPSLFNLNNLKNCSKNSVLLPYSNIVFSCLKIIYKYGYVESYKKKIINNFEYIEVSIRNDFFTKKNIITNIVFFSKPSCRVYKTSKELYSIYLRNKNKLILISTSCTDADFSARGIVSIEDAVRNNLGGEVLCEIF